jgi:hypothetical protein
MRCTLFEPRAARWQPRVINRWQSHVLAFPTARRDVDGEGLRYERP